MSIIKTDPCGFTPRDTEQNWAAEYARRIVTNEVKARIKADGAEAEARAAADKAEATDRKAADSSLHAAITAEELARKAADEKETAAREKGDESTLRAAQEYFKENFKIPPASITTLGGIKLYAGGGVNRSGLVVYEDGTAVVNTKPERGITRDGAGQIGINPATSAEAAAGSEAYKPITPATLRTELDRLDYNKYKFDGFDVDKTSNTIRLYKACQDKTIDSTYNEGIYSYYVSSKGESVSEMENDGVLFVLYNDGVIRQIMITEESDGSPIIYGRHCDYISETPGEWSEWDDTHTSTISDRSISSTTIDACEEYGIYPFLGSKSNIEAYNQSGLLITFWADWLQQAVIGDKGIYIRKKDGGSWSEWTQLGHTEIPPASIDVLGGIKPYAVGGINRSGLVIYEDGTAVVNTKTERGITRDGAGQIGINPATQDEVTAGTEAYKPVTPATLKAELERRGTDSGSSSISTEVVLPELPLTEFVENIAAVRIPVDFTPKPGMAVRVTENLWGGFDTILDVDNRTWLAASSFVNPGKSAIIMFGTSPTDEEPQSGVFYIINLD